MLAQASGEAVCGGIAARRGACFFSPAMATSGKTGKSGKSGKANARAVRQARLAAALRENLKRRKQQARQRAVADKTLPAEGSSQDAKAAPGAPDFRRNRDEE